MLDSAAMNPTASAIAGGAYWIENLVTGSLAVSLAVLAVAFLGYRMLNGRVPVASGARILIGCFIVFGAPVIASGFIGASKGAIVMKGGNTTPPAPDLSVRPPAYDPYAGPAMPVH